jgi:hypothetical protein
LKPSGNCWVTTTLYGAGSAPGMLDNVVAVLGLADIDQPWAHVLTAR